MNQQTLSFKHGVYVASRGTAASMKEGQGPIGSDIDQIFDEMITKDEMIKLGSS